MRNRETVALVVLFTVLCGGCNRSSGGSTKEQAHQTKEEPNVNAPNSKEQSEAREEEEEEGVAYNAKLLEHLKSRRCEHVVSILECDQCRYEVGAVQLSGSLKGGKSLVQTAPVSFGAKRARVRLNGEVTFDEKRVVHISPRIEGVARRVFVTTGDLVRAGAPLVEMDSLALGRLRSTYLQAKARLELARQNHEREKRLFKDQISSAKEKLHTETALQEARIALKATRDQLRLVGVSAGEITRLGSKPTARGGRMTLRSPRQGRVVAKHVVPGERLTPEKEVLTIADLSLVWVLASVYERDLASLLQAQAKGRLKAEVTVAAFPGRLFAGRVDYVGATMEEATRTVKIRVVVPNDKALLRPGMFAEVAIALGKTGQALYVPAEAVVSDGPDRFVFVKIGAERFLRRDVRTGEKSGASVEIVAGLEAKEEIVVRGVFLLKSDILRKKMGAGCAD